MANKKKKTSTSKVAKKKNKARVRKKSESKTRSGKSESNKEGLVLLDLKRDAYFATYIYMADLPDGKRISAELVSTIQKLRSMDPKGIVKSNVARVGAWHSKDNLEKNKAFDELLSYILASAQEIFNNLGYRNNTFPTISNMWANGQSTVWI